MSYTPTKQTVFIVICYDLNYTCINLLNYSYNVVYQFDVLVKKISFKNRKNWFVFINYSFRIFCYLYDKIHLYYLYTLIKFLFIKPILSSYQLKYHLICYTSRYAPLTKKHHFKENILIYLYN